MYNVKNAGLKISKIRWLALSLNASLITITSLLIGSLLPESGNWLEQAFLMKAILIGFACMIGIALTIRGYRLKVAEIAMPYVITKFEGKFGKDFAYSRHYDLPVNTVDDSSLLGPFDRVECSDMIKLQYPEGDKIFVCNISTFKVTTNAKGKEKKTLLESGIFVRRLTDMKTGMHLTIRDRRYSNDDSLYSENGDLILVREVAPEFDKAFTLYTSDAIQALRILTPSALEAFMKMPKIKGRASNVSINDNQQFLFVRDAEISIPVQSVLVRPNIDRMAIKSHENISSLINVMDLLYDEQRRVWLSKKRR